MGTGQRFINSKNINDVPIYQHIWNSKQKKKALPPLKNAYKTFF